MNILNRIILLIFIICNYISAQYQILPVKRDDFNRIKSWWSYHRDGSVKKDISALKNGNGYLYLQLLNPSDAMECNVGISERQNIYGKRVKKLIVEIRLKVLNDMLPGSRGWGFWKSARGGKASSVAWFMEQLLLGDQSLTWKMTGTIEKKKRAIKNIEIDFKEWHTYRIERYLINKTTDYYVDGDLIFSTPSVAPLQKMAFHLWIDNQVYSTSRGIQRQSWQGKSAIVIDYVQISTEKNREAFPVRNGMLLLHTKPNLFGNGTKDQLLKRFNFSSPGGKTVILATARTESYDQFDHDDKLKLVIDEEDERFVWDGEQLKGSSRCVLIERDFAAGNHQLDFISDVTPLLSNVTVLGASHGQVLINDEINASPAVDKSNYLWKEYSFETAGGQIVIYISGSADESPRWDHINIASRDNTKDDDLKVILDGHDFGWQNQYAFYGNQLFGDNDVIIIQKNLEAGNHILQLISNRLPTVYRVVVFEAPKS